MNAALMQFQPGDMLVPQNEISGLAYLIEAAGKMGMEIILNPSLMNDSILDLPLEYVRYFILNEVEARDLCGGEYPKEIFSDKLLEKFPRSRIVLTLGSSGSIYLDSQQRICQPAYPVKAVDTTAAGDTFTGYSWPESPQEMLSNRLRTCPPKPPPSQPAKREPHPAFLRWRRRCSSSRTISGGYPASKRWPRYIFTIPLYGKPDLCYDTSTGPALHFARMSNIRSFVS